jgi:hypothetical protein
MNKKIELNITERLRLYTILKIKIEDNEQFIDKYHDDSGLDFVMKCTKEENEILKNIAFKLDVL